MCKFRLLTVLVLAFSIMNLTGCAHKKKTKEDEIKPPTGKFMEHDPSRTQEKTLSDLMEDMYKKKSEKKRRMKDVSKPMGRESYQVFPWKKSGSRSEQLLEQGRNGESIY